MNGQLFNASSLGKREHASLFLPFTALIWATNCRRPGTEVNSVDGIPQRNPNGSVLDYANLPKIEEVMAELKLKVEAELSPHMINRLLNAVEAVDGRDGRIFFAQMTEIPE